MTKKQKYLGVPRASLLEGAKVKTSRDLQNAYGLIPKGTSGVIEWGYHIKDGGINFKAAGCSCCGVQLRMRDLHYSDLELTDEILIKEFSL